MCRLIKAAVRARTSSRSSEALTSSPISASVDRTSAEISVPPFNAVAVVCSSVGLMKSYYYSRRRRVRPAKLTPQSGFSFFPIMKLIVRACESYPADCDCFSGKSSVFGRLFLQARTQQQHANVGQISITLGVIKPVPDHKFVGNGKSDVVSMHGRDPAFRFV